MQPKCPRKQLLILYKAHHYSGRQKNALEINRLAADARARDYPPSMVLALYLAFIPLILRISRTFCHPHPGCQTDCVVADLHQDTYVIIRDLLKTWEPTQSGFCSYLSRLLGKRLSRSHKLYARIPETLRRIKIATEELSPSIAQDLDQDAIREKMTETILSNLQPSERDVICMRLWQRLSWKEIAAQTGTYPSVAKQRYWRLLERIRAEQGATRS
jgi:RNA polymerase sigma factor (sigma-70 family)